MKASKELYAVTGYVSNDLASRLSVANERSGIGRIEVKVERGFEEVKMGVDLKDVIDVRTGASSKGETLVQLFLRDGFNVETIITTPANVKGIARLYDPTLQYLIAAATAKKIMA